MLTTQQDNLYRKYVNCVIPRCQDTSIGVGRIYNFDDGIPFQSRLDETVYRIMAALPQHKKPVVLCSMQKDSLTVLDIVRRVNKNVDAFFFYHHLPPEFAEFQEEFKKLRTYAEQKNVAVINTDTDDRNQWIKKLVNEGYDLIMGGFYPAETTAEFREIMLKRGPYYFSSLFSVWFLDIIHSFSVKNVLDYLECYIPDAVKVNRPMKCVF